MRARIQALVNSMQPILVIAALQLFASYAYAGPTCEVAAGKREKIASFLCGRMAAREEERFSGANCMAAAARKRFGETAELIQAFQTCDEKQTAEQLKAAWRKEQMLLEMLSVCVPDRVDYKKLGDEAATSAEEAGKSPTCSPERQAFIKGRRDRVQRSIAFSTNDTIISRFFDKLGIQADSAGNIHDK